MNIESIGSKESNYPIPPRKGEGGLSGHKVTQKKGGESTEVKTTAVVQRLTGLEKEIQGIQRENFKHNYNLLLELQPGDISKLRAKNGRLELASWQFWVPKKEIDAALSLAQQTYRQAWGNLIDAHHGFIALPTALYIVNKLKIHLKSVYPQAIPQGEPEKPLSILSQGYRRLDSDSEIEKLDETSKEAYLTARKEREECVERISKKTLKFTALSKEQKGLTEAQIVKFKGVKEIPVAIQKSADEKNWAVMIAEENGMDEKKYEPFTFLSGFNESLASHLNVLMSGELGIPLAVKGKEVTQHAYAKHEGSYSDYIKKYGIETAPELLDEEASQRLVFAELITRNADCHSNNILISKNNEPIPIDFGRILSTSIPIRAGYLEFPCLDAKINPQDKKFYSQLDIEGIVTKLRKALEVEYPDKFKEGTISLRVINKQLEMLKARLLMVKMGVEMGLNQRQLIALDLPKLSGEVEKKCEELKDISFQYRDEPLQAIFFKQIGADLENYRRAQGFQTAWDQTFDADTNTLNETSFKKMIESEIRKIQKLPPQKLYRGVEKFAYNMADYDALLNRQLWT